jgi:hypothetical protein
MGKEKEPIKESEKKAEPPKEKINLIDDFDPPKPDRAAAYFQKLEEKIDRVLEKLYPAEPPTPPKKSAWDEFWGWD